MADSCISRIACCNWGVIAQLLAHAKGKCLLHRQFEHLA